MSEALLDLAREHHRAGRLDQAIAAYRELTAAAPGVAEYWKLKAIAEHQARHLDDALASIRQSLRFDPAQAQSHLVEGHIHEDRMDVAAAEASFREAVRLQPGWAAAWNSLGTRLLDERRALEAVGCFQRAVDAAPNMVRSWNNLGLAQLSLERFDDAMRAFNHAVTLDPAYGMPHFNLARVHQLRGDNERALDAAQHAVRLDARLAEAHLLIGDLQRARRDVKAAQQAYLAAAAVDAGGTRAQTALADLYWEAGEVDAARRTYEAVSNAHPGNFKAAVGRRLLLPAVYDSVEHLERCRDDYARGLGALHDMADAFRWTRAEDALADTRWTNFYLAYQGRDDRELQRAYGKLMQRVLRPAVPQWLQARPSRAASRARIRVGFFSFYFFNCTVGRYFASWIEGLDRSRFEVFVYYTNPWVADDTRRIAACAERFRHLPGRPLHVLATEILDADLDVLVYPELGMNSDTFTLASLRLAPVQVAGWGHPTTTGLPTIDWFLTSRDMEPPQASSYYTERLAGLPGLGTRYAKPSGEEQGTREDFGLPADRHLYLVPQSIFKIHPDNDALLADVLARDPLGSAVMFAANHPGLTDRFVARLGPHFQARGMAVAERVIFLPYMKHGAYLRLNRLCDVMLDTVHWSGGNTSLDALASGLPVVTLPGDFMRGRQSMGMLRLLGVEELITASAEEYAARAVAVGTDRAQRDALSRRIEAGLGALFDRDEPVAAFADFLERAVRDNPPSS